MGGKTAPVLQGIECGFSICSLTMNKFEAIES
jgi:hypothetical protein